MFPGRHLLLIAAIAAAASCTRHEASPPSHTRSDVNLRVETVTVESRVPRHATLDALLREQQLVAPIVEAAVSAARSVFDLRQLRCDNAPAPLQPGRLSARLP